MLAVDGLVVRYGQVTVLGPLDLSVRGGEILAVLGANGAGKTSMLHAIAGITAPASGEVLAFGSKISRLSADRVIRHGVSLVPEGRQLFGDQSVQDNLRLGCYSKSWPRREVEVRLEREFARFPILRERRTQLASSLSGGEQQMLAVSRALMSDPRLILLDEPSTGLAPLVVRHVMAALASLRQAGLGVLLVEQVVEEALSVADRVVVLQRGKIAFEGTPGEIRMHRALISAYLG
jgi:branched-chain amino acid transport system ATP-binding protein